MLSKAEICNFSAPNDTGGTGRIPYGDNRKNNTSLTNFIMMRKFILSIYIALSGINYGLSQNSFYTFLGASSYVDVGVKTIETFDGNIVVTGFTNWSSWGYDGVVIKLDLNGDTIWTRTFSDTSTNIQMSGGTVAQLADSGLIVVFSITAQSCTEDILFIKLNLEGDTLWTRRYGFNDLKTDYIHNLIETSDGGYMAVGQSDRGNNTTTDMRGFIIKLNSNGDTLWSKTYRNYQNTLFSSIKQTPESNYVVCGLSVDSIGVYTCHANLMKIDSTGSIIWVKYFDLPGLSAARSLEISNDGYLIVGESASINESQNFILRTDTSGTVLWCKKYELMYNIGFSSNIAKCSSGGYFFSENLMDTSFVSEIMLMKIDEDGIPIWANKFSGNPWAYQNGIFGTSDGGCLITGQYSDTIMIFPEVIPIEQDILLIRTDSIGSTNCHQSSVPVIYDSLSVVEVILPMNISSGVNLHPNAISLQSGYSEDYTCSTNGIQTQNDFQLKVVIFPNPSSGMITFSSDFFTSPTKVKVYDTRGNTLFQDALSHNSSNQTTIQLNIPDGMYILQISNEHIAKFEKLIILNN